MGKKKELGSIETDQLVASLNSFIQWLVEIGVSKNLSSDIKLVDFPFSSEDWFMRVEGDTVSFNAEVRKKCSFEYYQMVVLHEYFHLMVQKIPNKGDATRIKDHFGDPLMKLIDIEADFYTALYYKEKLNFTLIKFLGLYFDGKTVFNNERIRTGKFERYIGSILSVSNLFIKYPIVGAKDIDYDLFLPTIIPVYAENKLHVLIAKKEHFFVDEINVNHNDLVDLMKCYRDVLTYTKIGYTTNLISFIYKAFGKDVPKEVTDEINKIKE